MMSVGAWLSTLDPEARRPWEVLPRTRAVPAGVSTNSNQPSASFIPGAPGPLQLFSTGVGVKSFTELPP